MTAMKAAVMHGVRDVRCEAIDRPTLASGEALLRVKACGICGSDLHTYREGLFEDLGAPTDGGRVLGHEFSGVIAEINGTIDGLNVGDRVTTVGIGANAEYIRISAEMTPLVLPVPAHISHQEAATTEPLATSLHAANLAKVQDGERVVIMGAGIIGLGVVQCIRATSNAHITVVDLSDKRLELASALGANEVINARHEDAVATVAPEVDPNAPLISGTHGGVDAVFDCVGAPATFKGTTVLEQALSMVRQNGRVIVVAVFERPVEIEANVIVRKGVQMLGSWAWEPPEFVQALELISSGKIDRKPLISHEFSLDHAAEAYATQDSADTAIKVVFVP